MAEHMTPGDGWSGERNVGFVFSIIKEILDGRREKCFVLP